MIERLLQRLAKTLQKHRIPYMLIGGQAVLLYGYPRLTHDVDVTLGIDIDAYPLLQDACRKAGLRALVKEPEIFVRKTRVLPVQDRQTGFRIDFIFSNTPYEKLAIRRARHTRIGRAVVKMASLEDLVIHKLVAGRPIDIEDVRILVAKNRSSLDRSYLRRWLKKFSALEILPHDPLRTFNQLLRRRPRGSGPRPGGTRR